MGLKRGQADFISVGSHRSNTKGIVKTLISYAPVLCLLSGVFNLCVVIHAFRRVSYIAQANLELPITLPPLLGTGFHYHTWLDSHLNHTTISPF